MSNRALVDALVKFKRWSELAATIRNASLDSRRARKATERNERERSPRYQCLSCRDSGAVMVYYPPFVDWLRPRFEQWQATGFPRFWYSGVAREWYGRLSQGEVKGPAEITVACHCQCEYARIYQQQVAAMNESRGTQKPRRAAHPGVWNPQRQCLSSGDAEHDLAEWYATHQAHEWAPAEGEYDARFN